MNPFPLHVTLFLIVLLSACSQPTPKWQQLHQEPGDVSFRGIAAVNDSTCWVSGSQGTILRTIDGGKSWQSKSIPDTDSLDFRDIAAFGTDTVVAMSIGKGSKSRLYRTLDGGDTWEMVFQNSYEEGFYDAIAFWDGKHGLLQGDPVDGRLYLLRTSDGGTTWREIPYKNRPLMHEGEYAFAASGTQLIVHGDGNAWIGTGGSRARIFSSTDYGKTWQSTSTPIIQGEPSTGIFSLALGKNGILMAVGGDYTKPTASNRTLIISKNNGESWQLHEPSQLEYRSAIEYLPTQKTFIATGPTGSEISTNKGIDWQRIEGPGFHTLDAGIQQSTIVWAAGSNGRIAKLYIKSFNFR